MYQPRMTVYFNSIVLSTMLVVGNCRQHDRPHRSMLSHEWVAGYEPESAVADFNAMDLDQLAMEIELGKATEDAFVSAQAIYEIGGNSVSVAALTVRDGLPMEVFKGMPVEGRNANDETIVGTVYEHALLGSTELKVRYFTSTIRQQDSFSCKVGALTSPIIDGCFKNGNSTLSILDNQIDYEYDLFLDTANAHTLEQLSNEDGIFSNEEGFIYDRVDNFVDYYGEADYARKIIDAAFDGGEAVLNGKVFNFESYPLEARAQVIKKSTVNMGFAMTVIDALEISFRSCEEQINFSSDPIESLDRAVALYTGSMEGHNGFGDGYLLYNQADLYCARFRTCDDTADSVSGTSMVNLEIFQLFDLMKEHIKNDNCEAARLNKEDIVKKMFIPMVQGAIRSAFIQNDYIKTDENEQSEGIAFAAAILPLVAMCSEDDANIVYDNLVTHTGFDSDFTTVKSAFERNYDCMGMTCEDVGGLLSKATGEFYVGAQPCVTKSSGKNTATVVGLFFAGVVLLFVLIGFLVKRRSKTSDGPCSAGANSIQNKTTNHTIV